MTEYQRRLRAGQHVKIDVSGTTYLSPVRQYHGKKGIAQERLPGGNWVVRIAGEDIIFAREHIIALN